ncbi:MAG: acyl-CoA dehydrogenase family protein [Chloroflexota bacterium]|nr:acyl-CoA dehydrogenase family protein [Chloroflexota bacterium]
MNLEMNETEREIMRMIRDFATKEVKPRAAQIDATSQFPEDLMAKMGELGLLGLSLPEEYGGAGQSYVLFARFIEELSCACATTGLAADVNISLGAEPVLMFGNEEEKKEWLPAMASGEKLGALAITEPDAGSDAAGITTTAVRDGDSYIINGSKTFITLGGVAHYYVTSVVTNPKLVAKHKHMSMLMVEKGTPGLSFSQPFHKMGITGSPTVQIFYENVRVPASNLIGQEGDGFKISMATLDGGRIGIAAQAVGIARAALEDCIEYANTRKQFGKVITQFQGIQFMLADMGTAIDAARLLTLRAAYLREKGIPCARESSMAKLFAGDTAMEVSTNALQIFGGYGYMKDYAAERHMRDAKITQLYEGTQQIQRLVVARSILKAGS